VKLKLEVQENIHILCITEDVLAQYAQMLKAGIIKLFRSGKKTILLDMVNATQVDEAIIRELQVIANYAPEIDCQIVIASPITGFGHAPSRDLAIKMMTAPIFGLMSTEAKLQARIKKLEKSKTNLMERLAALKDATEIFQLTKSNTDLRTAIKALERKVQRLLNARVEAKPPMNLSERMSLVEKTLGSVLGQDGVVTIK
jgi:hypothetical protein